MRKGATYLIPLLLITLSFFGIGTATAQHRLGVVWDIPENEVQALQQLELFRASGIETLELYHPANPDELVTLDEFDFSLFIRTSHMFITSTQIRASIPELKNNLLALAGAYNSHTDVSALGIFTNSQVRHPDFDYFFSPVLDSLQAHTQKEIYFHESGFMYYFHRPETPFAAVLFDEQFLKSDLLVLNEKLRSNVAQGPELLFVHSRWLSEAVEVYPELGKSLAEYAKTGEWIFPMPAIPPVSKSGNFSVLILILLWGSLAMLLKWNPGSRAMIGRYLLSHRFYADDIIHYRERSAAASLTLLAQHAVFSGLAVYMLAHYFLSETGVDAFFYHLPALALLGRNYSSFFALGLLASLILPLISLPWLHFTSKRLRHFSQTLNLYSGIFALDFILITTIVTLYQAGTGDFLIRILFALFFLCWILAFYIAALDVHKSLMVGRGGYFALTMALHTLILLLAGGFLYKASHLMQVIDLALFL